MRGRQIVVAICGALLTSGAIYGAQTPEAAPSATELRMRMQSALKEAQAAKVRSAYLTEYARRADAYAEASARQASSLAAQIQEREAELTAIRAQLAVIKYDRQALEAGLAREQKPLVGLTATLQKLARLPLSLAVLRPESLSETVYTSAMIAAILPEVRTRTAGLRAKIAARNKLVRERQIAVARFVENTNAIAAKHKSLMALEMAHRLKSRELDGSASKAAAQAITFAESARNMDALIAKLSQASSLRDQLAALPGPILRPSSAALITQAGDIVQEPQNSSALASLAGSARRFRLPAIGIAQRGFGELKLDGIRAADLTLRVQPNAQITAPAAGEVAFAGNYRGFGKIVIIDHGGGIMSIVTGLARLSVITGNTLIDGTPIGNASQARPTITFEIRRNGVSVNPLDFVG